ncbi:GNAT family N-acetyltransferase [Sinomicrobium pectinilyticum]|uniref:GNAT family N-acetyltransferase n=1 Tax=Sinomicrobium pectinilyticum TaxID=1084421 RepID=A0A3N0EER5_SINP1|nr:GNAT family N-acetyltransferase [Sinomicrobium pectinilyticum]RNL86346.1 GNAT family N-acetyltransferase [Sinomicrobium pectinilyticum]
MAAEITIRPGKPEDLPELQQLFRNTILSVCRTDYTAEQTRAWASGIENESRWQNVMGGQFVVIAEEKEKITGFCTLLNYNHIDLLFVHHRYQRQGIARKLYGMAEKEAINNGQTRLTANVSKTAKPFFEQCGFRTVKEQVIFVKGTELTNYVMTKTL